MNRGFDSSPLAGYVLHHLSLQKDGCTYPFFLRPLLVEQLKKSLVVKTLETPEFGNQQVQDAQPSNAEGVGAMAALEPAPSAVEAHLLRLLAIGRLRKELEDTFIRQFENSQSFDELTVPVHRVLRGVQLLKAFARAVVLRDKDDRAQELEQLTQLARQGAYRRIATPDFTPDRLASAFEQLRDNHPQFLAVTRYVQDCIALAAHSGGAPRMTPILLVGPPGVGKSFYAADLARAIGVPMRRQSMENAQTTALLLGTERHWSTAAPGLLYEEVVLGEVANPLFLIEEIDKCPSSGRAQYDPINSFHSILEPETAAAVRDAALDIEFDASLVMYVATANDVDPLPASIRSRFKIFTILPPTGEGALALAHAVAVRAVQTLGVLAFRLPGNALTNKLAHLTPREIAQCVPQAVARAVCDGRRALRLDDFPPELLGDPPAKAGPPLH